MAGFEDIREHMEVIGADGVHVGTVDHLDGDRIKLIKKDSPQGHRHHHHYISRGLVAGVFVNRLRIGMLLQTDPTVIYGLGAAFDGNLRKRDLLTDTPYNTYTRSGLPPTPIALPGMASLRAAVRPQPTKALYFVARGDGSSVFSETLAEHNRAVNKYQRGLP